MNNLALKTAEEFLPLEAEEQLEVMLRQVFPGRTAVLTSFGAESAVLLDMVARIDPATAVVFLDTGMHFPETLAYRDLLQQRLGLTDIRTVSPQRGEVNKLDPDARLHERDHDACCSLRKVNPLGSARGGFNAWITGRKRHHGEGRTDLATIELDDEGYKLNPLAGWSEERIEEAFVQRGLPRHPLTFEGYQSIGCAPCTNKTLCGKNSRSGRWANSNKTECGIHK